MRITSEDYKRQLANKRVHTRTTIFLHQCEDCRDHVRGEVMHMCREAEMFEGWDSRWFCDKCMTRERAIEKYVKYLR